MSNLRNKETNPFGIFGSLFVWILFTSRKYMYIYNLYFSTFFVRLSTRILPILRNFVLYRSYFSESCVRARNVTYNFTFNIYVKVDDFLYYAHIIWWARLYTKSVKKKTKSKFLKISFSFRTQYSLWTNDLLIIWLPRYWR